MPQQKETTINKNNTVNFSLIQIFLRNIAFILLVLSWLGILILIGLTMQVYFADNIAFKELMYSLLKIDKLTDFYFLSFSTIGYLFLINEVLLPIFINLKNKKKMRYILVITGIFFLLLS